MKPEDLFHGITQVRDGLVEEAAPRARRSKKRWLGALAAVLALAVGVGALWPGTDWSALVQSFHPFGKPADPYLGALVNSPYAVALAYYPEQAVHPELYDADSPNGMRWDSAEYSQAHELWQDDRWKRISALQDYNGELDGFFSAVMTQFLTGEDGENRVISPVNLYMALAMLAEITGGDSRQQVLDLVGAESIGQLREQAGRVWTGLYRNDGTDTVILGSSLWMNQDIQFVQETMDTLARDYYASSFRGEMGSAEFDQALRDWLNGQTGGLLGEQAAGLSMDPDTVLALASTVYFSAKWSSEFSKNRTGTDVFHAPGGDVKCEFMHQESRGSYYYWGDNFSAICQGFEGGGLMWLILPDEGVTAEDLLTDPQVARLVQNYREWENRKLLLIHKSIPKFDAVSDQDLVQGLQELGLTDVFDFTMSDFTPMTTQTEEIFLSNVQHAARVKIDEEGCEAAAYTLMLVGAAEPPEDEDEVDFVLDRPFLFVVTSDVGGLPLFAGIVNRP